MQEENPFNSIPAVPLILVGIITVIELILSMIFGSTPTWIAEVAGFVVGLIIAPLLAPGGWSAFLARMRQR